MKITRKGGSGSAVTLVINVPPNELEILKDHVLSHFRDSVKVPGFRPGTAPEHLIEKNADQRLLLDEYLNHAVNQFYGKAIEVEKIRPVSQPKITVKKFVPYTELEFEAEVEDVGAIALGDYKKIRVSRKPVSVTAKDVDEVLKNLRQRMAERKEVDRPAKAGDEVLIDFDGFDKEGKAIDGASAKNYPLTLGSKSFIPGFEDNLVGAKAGQALEIKLKFPKDYTPELAGKPVDFKVKLHKVSELSEPKLDDALAAKAGPFKTLADLKADIKRQLKAEREVQAEREYENELLRKIVSQSRLEAPRTLVDAEIERLETEEKRNLTYQGKTWSEHLKEEGITEEEHRERQRPQAEERVKGGLVLTEIAEKEKIQVSDAEIDAKISQLKAQYTDATMQAELEKADNRNEIASRLMTEKTVAKLKQYSAK